MGSQDLIANIPRVLHARETPVTEASDIPIFLLAQLARTKVTVVLSGEGSDEILAGYPKYAFERLLGRPLDRLPRPLLAALAKMLALPPASGRAGARMPSPSRSRSSATPHGSGRSVRRSGEELLTPGLLVADALHVHAERLLRHKRFPSRVEQMLYLDTQLWLPANLLLRGDRMTMAHSLELRCPFLDHRLVEMA